MTDITVNCLCYVYGSVEVGRVMAIAKPVDLLHVEIGSEQLWVTRNQVSHCWTADSLTDEPTEFADEWID